MMISQITDNEFSYSQRIQQFGQCFCTVLTDLQHITEGLYGVPLKSLISKILVQKSLISKILAKKIANQ